MRPTTWPSVQRLSRMTRLGPPTLLARKLSSASRLLLRTTELAGPDLGKFRVNGDRLWDTIHSTAQWSERRGTPADNDDMTTVGLTRLTLSEEDKRARDWFVSTTEALGCKTHVDQVGNIFAIRPGLNSDVAHPAPTFAGSHLDSQPSGGRFDGVLGVAAAVEMLRVLNENWIETEGPVGVVNWTNEEGAKYPISMMGSGVWAGRIPLDTAWSATSLSSNAAVGPVTTVKEELEKIGYLGREPASFAHGVRLGAHFELHIEQGPKLKSSQVGVVQGVQAYKWFTVVVTGRESHAGTTDFANRADALHAAATLVTVVREIAEQHGGLATVGRLALSPSSVNTVAGEVRMSLDVRHPSDQSLGEMVDMIEASCRQISSQGKGNHLTEISIRMHEDFSSKATKFDPEAIACVEASAAAVLGEDHESRTQRMTSGAGHDSVCTNVHCPTAMIFIPCKDGISHNPREWSEKEDCAIGADVLLQSVLRMDKLRKERGDFD